jgi:hypothetical protein
MAPRVFVNFRKADERVLRGRIHRSLVEHFGPDQVFKSGSSIEPGSEYAGILLRQAAQCEVMLVLIGPGWLALRDRAGHRLLDRDFDWVREEIATSVRAGNRVIPVLLGDTVMLPAENELPSDIAVLARLQFLRIEESRVDSGLQELVATLSALLPGLAPVGTRSEAAPNPPAAQKASVRGGGVALNVGQDLLVQGSIIGGDQGSPAKGTSKSTSRTVPKKGDSGGVEA